MHKCETCKKEISVTAKVCPHCGLQRRVHFYNAYPVLTGIMGIIIFSSLFSCVKSSFKEDNKPIVVEKVNYEKIFSKFFNKELKQSPKSNWEYKGDKYTISAQLESITKESVLKYDYDNFPQHLRNIKHNLYIILYGVDDGIDTKGTEVLLKFNGGRLSCQDNPEKTTENCEIILKSNIGDKKEVIKIEKFDNHTSMRILDKEKFIDFIKENHLFTISIKVLYQKAKGYGDIGAADFKFRSADLMWE